MSGSDDGAVRCVGVEVSRTALTAVCVSSDGRIGATANAEIDLTRPSSGQVAEFVAGLKVSCGDFVRVGIAVPGLVTPDGRSIAYSVHIPQHSGLELAGEIESACGKPVSIENDANAAAYGEYRLGSGQGSRHMVYITLGEGVGGAIIIDGRIWRGAAGFAGEFGYIPINSEGLRLEEVASAANIVRRTRSRFHQDSTSSLVELDENQITIADIVQAADAGDDFAHLMLERTGNYVGTGVASVINLLNIEKIVIGGEVMAAKHIVLDAIIARARELSFRPSFDSTSIVGGDLGGNAAAIGAALLACEAADGISIDR